MGLGLYIDFGDTNNCSSTGGGIKMVQKLKGVETVVTPNWSMKMGAAPNLRKKIMAQSEEILGNRGTK